MYDMFIAVASHVRMPQNHHATPCRAHPEMYEKSGEASEVPSVIKSSIHLVGRCLSTGQSSSHAIYATVEKVSKLGLRKEDDKRFVEPEKNTRSDSSNDGMLRP